MFLEGDSTWLNIFNMTSERSIFRAAHPPPTPKDDTNLTHFTLLYYLLWEGWDKENK